MSTTQLFLAKHAHFCFDENFCVFLDLKNDDYLCVERSLMTSLGPRLAGWTQGYRSVDLKRAAGACSVDLATQLVDAGLITPEASEGKPAVPTALRLPTQVLNDTSDRLSLRKRLPHLAFFLKAAHKAHRNLTNQHLATSVRAVELRKSRAFSASHDTTELAKLVSIFHQWRPIYPRDHLCLFESLALLEFLAGYNFYPDWVYGVKSEPFLAHCWVQANDLVLNDTLEHVCRYTPIMVV